MDRAGLAFVDTALPAEVVRGTRVLEVGSLTTDAGDGTRILSVEELADPADSVRGLVTSRAPGEYVGLDMLPGPGVDVVGRVEDLVSRFGTASFDIVIATELLEHVPDWRTAVRQLAGVLRPGGRLVVTTRAPGFPFHRAPWDFWRYSASDAAAIFPGCSVEDDPVAPGIFVVAGRELGELDAIALESILTGRRQLQVGRWDSLGYRIRHPRLLASWLMPRGVKRALKPVLPSAGR